METSIYTPIILCDCGTSMHESNIVAHSNRKHSAARPATYSYPSASAIIRSGWAREEFTHWPYA